MESSNNSINRQGGREAYRIIIFGLLVFIFSLWLGSRFNDFPFFYHPDEPTKVRQIIEGQRNFHHPLLMLEVADLSAKVLRVAREPQVIAVLGRWLSAIYSALAVTVIALLCWRWFGWLVAVLAVWMMALHADIFTLAHYFKEDPALLLAFALLFLTAWWWERSRAWLALLALGVAVGVTVAAKYAGALALVMALGLVVLVLWRDERVKHKLRRAGTSLLLVLVAAALTFVVINQRMFSDWEQTTASLERETDLVLHGQGGLSREVPHAKYFKRFARQTGPVMMPFYVVGLVFLWLRRKQLKPAASLWMLIVFPFLMTIMLSFSAKLSGRYFLPAFLGIFPVVAYGAVAIANKLRAGEWLANRPKLAKSLAVAAIVFPLVVAPIRMIEYWNGLKRSVRVELFDFVRNELPADAVIIQGRHVWLPDQTHEWAAAWREFPPQQIKTVKNVADYASLAELRNQGVTHVALSEDEYGKYLRKNAKPRDGYADRYQRRRAFYQELADSCDLVWQRDARKVGTHNPPLKLWQLQ